MIQRYLAKLSFDGTAYHGWQVQNNANTIQAEISKALRVITKKLSHVTGCGRTDTGVHANEFFADWLGEINVELDEFTYKLNRLLPKDIAVQKVVEVPCEFNARFDALHRTYKYYVHTEKDPFLLGKSNFYKGQALNINLMNEACKILFDYEDFTSFSKSKTDTKTNNCTITFANWDLINHKLVFTITANRFLRNMVRAITGTLFMVGTQEISIQQFKEIIESKNRSKAGKSVAAEGLYLWSIKYPPETERLFNE